MSVVIFLNPTPRRQNTPKRNQHRFKSKSRLVQRKKKNRNNIKIYNYKHLFYFQRNLLAGDRGVTCTCTAIWCCPTAHKYQAVSLSCSFFRVTVKALILSSLIASEESSKLPSASVSRQELQSPFRHHFFTLCLSTGSHRGSR